MIAVGPSPRGKERFYAGPYTDGASRDRTGDLLLAKQALSQLSYGPWGGSSLAPNGD
jgi:hypothetical protein